MKVLMTGVAAAALAGAGLTFLPHFQMLGGAAAEAANEPASDRALAEPPDGGEVAIAASEPVDLSATPLTVSLDGETVPHPVWHHLVMPGETIALASNLPLSIEMNGEMLAQDADMADWTAPDTPGTHRLVMTDAAGRTVEVSVFVLAPLGEEEILEGYRIGTYPADAPEGLIRLTEADMDAPVSPNFTIGQFICKQQPGHWPKFLLVSPTMLTRLEALLASMQAEGLTEASSFFVMSGYRTPFYNTAIGSARFSRHMYGDAADIYPDVVGGDGVMDDLDGDGRITRADAEYLYDYAESLYTADPAMPEGGIGAYSANAVHGPFVHIDGRGHAARWGRNG
ncbi:D-Ala-D-Ala carboxypeptidase family metallohydrolase [Hyphobacterium marinum]|uniref:D-Ala-D-Ala carboxypeptidase family metallohydrolase n=1 Tax=Hyphobacterium marinum TaxID=3116574 RepID=A0ABU7M002_9PROT|nr:D-Ala-D-Ala carboxypeptidase family metallohydrolase [Hyphobacterium sp. Y6023]MEE2566867.1 D-Ala-D-Ala carboxypeptidase family metallohydrolase [Hyphobacterium sp. Y6023]